MSYNIKSIIAVNNTVGLECQLVKPSEEKVNVLVSVGATPASIEISVSEDGTNWKLIESFDLVEPITIIDYPNITFKYIKAEVLTTAIDVEIEIKSMR